MGPLLALLTELAPLVQKYGPTLVAAVSGIFTKTTAPTQTEWDALLKATSTLARDQMLATLAAHGIDPNSPAGQAFLALT